jgi:3-hydroxyisobutyrate dehydrogenase-like beta-hydroxyacid dehydrogenase
MTVGIVSPGAMGSALGAVLARGGARLIATVAARSQRTAGLARAAGIECLPSLGAVVREADVVLSVAPPGEAEAIAGDVARAAQETGTSPLFADLNAVSPGTMRSIAARLEGLDVVDGAISGPPPRADGTTRIYLSGARASELAALGWPGVEIVLVGAELGLASAVKMCTASVYKGTAALLTHALITARANGVLEHVLADFAASPPNLAEGAERWLADTAAKSARYVAEMREIASTQAAAGLPPALFDGVAAAYAALSQRPLARLTPEEAKASRTLDDVLARLSPSE